MSAIRKSRSITFDDLGDEITGPFKVNEIVFSGRNLAAGDLVEIQDTDSGSVLGSLYTEAGTQYEHLMQMCRWVKKLKVTSAPGSGEWVIVVNTL